jgi:hypothetical protein
MKAFLIVATALGLLISVIVKLENTDAAIAATEARTELRVNNQLNDIVYYVDVATNPPLCFAYTWLGGANGGAGMAAVSCASVPNAIEFTSSYE